MKKTAKYLLFIMLAIALTFSLAACGLLGNDDDGDDGQTQPTKLDTPTNVQIEGGYVTWDGLKGKNLTWDKVSSASGYVVDIDGTEYPINDKFVNNQKASYRLHFLPASATSSTLYKIKVKAKASENNNNYIDSDWSLTVDYEHEQVEVTVHLDAQGGGIYPSTVYAHYGSDMPWSVANGKPQRMNFIFEGFFSEPDGQGKQYYNADMSSTAECDLTEETTLYAKWSVKYYSIIFDKQGGTGGTDSVTVTYDSPLPSAEAPTREGGYFFVGYYAYLGLGDLYKFYDADMTPLWERWTQSNNPNDLTLYARWDITLDMQGGEGGADRVSPIINSEMPTMKPAPTRTGYTFGGYYSEPNGQGVKYYLSNMQSAAKWDNSAGTLYANWIAKQYDVYFNANGGSYPTEAVPSYTYYISFDLNGKWGIAPATQTVTSERGLVSVRPADYKAGNYYYMFKGWYTEPSDGILFDFSATVTESRTLYAQWFPLRLNTHWYQLRSDGLIYYNGNGSEHDYGSGYDYYVPTNSHTVLDDRGIYFVPLRSGTVTMNITARIPTFEYLVWFGYGGSSTFGFSYRTECIGNSSFTFNVTAGRAFYIGIGLWTGVTYENLGLEFIGISTVTSLPYSGGKAPSVPPPKPNNVSVVATFGQSMPLSGVIAPEPRSGYVFMGYYDTKAATGGTKYYNSDLTSARIWDLDAPYSTTLYARWNTAYSITYNYNGGTLVDNPSIYHIESEFTLNEPVWSGRDFLGWYKNAQFTGETVWGISSGTTGNLTLYAKWDEDYPDKTPVPLEIPNLQVVQHGAYTLLFWSEVENAEGYTLKINNQIHSAYLNSQTHYYECYLWDYGVHNIELTAKGGKKTSRIVYTDSTASYSLNWQEPEINNYQDLENAVNKKIGDALRRYNLYKPGTDPYTGMYKINIMIGNDGVVRAQWSIPYMFWMRDCYTEYQIPNVDQNSTLAQWVAALKSVDDSEIINNILDQQNSLYIYDAQILFEYALDQCASAADKSLLANAQVIMVKEAETKASAYSFKFWVLSSDGKIYEVALLYQKSVSNIYDLAADSNKNCLSFSIGVDFALANTLFPT